jgi:hypothetical protein
MSRRRKEGLSFLLNLTNAFHSAFNIPYETSPIGCWPKESQVVQKTQASRGAVFFYFLR